MKKNYIFGLFCSISISLLLDGCNTNNTQNQNLSTASKNNSLNKIQSNVNSPNKLLDIPDTGNHSLVSNNQFMYVIDSESQQLMLFNIDPQTGHQSKIYESSIPTGNVPTYLAVLNTQYVESNNNYVYVINNSDYTISEYEAIGDSGILSYLGNIQTGAAPSDIITYEGYQTPTVAPYVYVSNASDNSISAYTVNNSHLLEPIPGGNVKTGRNPNALITAKNFLYVLNSDDATISMFAINETDGSLSSLGDPVQITNVVNNALYTIKSDPTNNYIYVVNQQQNNESIGLIYSFKIGANGTLSPIGNPVLTGHMPQDIVIYESFAYVTNANDDNIYTYKQTNGILTQIYVPTDVDPNSQPSSLVADDGSLYLLNTTSGVISMFDIMPADDRQDPGLLMHIYNSDPITQYSLSDLGILHANKNQFHYLGITAVDNDDFIVVGSNGAIFEINSDLSSYSYYNPHLAVTGNSLPDLRDVAYNSALHLFVAVGDGEVLVGNYDESEKIIWTEVTKPSASLTSVSMNAKGDIVAVGTQGQDAYVTYHNGSESETIYNTLNNLMQLFSSNYTYPLQVNFCDQDWFYMSLSGIDAIMGFENQNTSNQNWLQVTQGIANAFTFDTKRGACDSKYLTIAGISASGGTVWANDLTKPIYVGGDTIFNSVAMNDNYEADARVIAVGTPSGGVPGGFAPIVYSPINDEGYPDSWQQAYMMGNKMNFVGLNKVAIASVSGIACAVGFYDVVCSKDGGHTWASLTSYMHS